MPNEAAQRPHLMRDLANPLNQEDQPENMIVPEEVPEALEEEKKDGQEAPGDNAGDVILPEERKVIPVGVD